MTDEPYEEEPAETDPGTDGDDQEAAVLETVYAPGMTVADAIHEAVEAEFPEPEENDGA